jgi:hypothetical protein
MNRAQRRQLGTKQKDPLYTLKESQLRNTIARKVEPELKQVYAQAVKLTLGAVALALNDVYGFKSGRIGKVLNKVHATCECIEAGTVTIEDILEQVKEETGVDIR